jgi:hypothetical protein
MKKFLLCCFAAILLPSLAMATNYFNWDCETTNTSLGAIQSIGNGTSIVSGVYHNGTHSMRIIVPGDDGGNNQAGVEPGNFSYGYNVINSQAIYYRWWMRINTGFSWGNSTAKTKANRVLDGSSVPRYTGYVSKSGITIGECTDSAGCLAQGGASNSSDEVIRVDYNFSSMADNAWHEYVVMVKPNTTTSTLNAQLQLWVDGTSQGTYNNFLLTNSNYAMTEAWGAWMVRPYFQLNGGSSDGGTIYLDDFSIDNVWNSTYSGADTTPPIVPAFTLQPTSASLTVPISSFTAADYVGVTGYCVTATNSSSGCSWNGTAQTSITFSTSGAQTAYGWARDAAGNVSASSSSSTSIALPGSSAANNSTHKCTWK